MVQRGTDPQTPHLTMDPLVLSPKLRARGCFRGGANPFYPTGIFTYYATVRTKLIIISFGTVICYYLVARPRLAQIRYRQKKFCIDPILPLFHVSVANSVKMSWCSLEFLASDCTTASHEASEEDKGV